MNKQSNQNAPIEWLVVHHQELNGGARQLILQHLIAPEFTAEVTEKINYEVNFTEHGDKFSSQKHKNHWERKVIAFAKSEIPKQFSQTASPS
jgi:hypothetical protein